MHYSGNCCHGYEEISKDRNVILEKENIAVEPQENLRQEVKQKSANKTSLYIVGVVIAVVIAIGAILVTSHKKGGSKSEVATVSDATQTDIEQATQEDANSATQTDVNQAR